jgi:hypothetical protein
MLYREITTVRYEINTKHINTLCGQNVEFLGPFPKMWKVTISFVMSVYLSVCVSEQLGSHYKDFRGVWNLRIFKKSVEVFQVSLKSDNNNIGYFKRRPAYIYNNSTLNSSDNVKCFRQSCGENQDTYLTFNNAYFRKSCHLWENVEKYCTAG